MLCSLLSTKLVDKKLRLVRLNTEETFQAAATFIIYNKNKDTRLQIILCKLEIFCFPFIKKMLGNTLYFQNQLYSLSLSLMHSLSDE